MIKINRPFVFSSKRYFDKRGYFQELYLKKNFKHLQILLQSHIQKKVIRGMHFQLKHKQTKIITVLSGKIMDISINLKKKFKTFR